MTKFKSTKRALLTSALALLVCVSMLVGSTFAWFTDSVTSAGNTIQSGTLKVDLVDADGNSMEGQVIEFVADGRAQNEILWEPGCKYETKPVYVVNKGNLALKYQIVINGITGNAKLLEAIEWTVTVGDVKTELADLRGELLANETSAAIVLTGHMKKTAGNEYQGLTVDGISITVFATQLTSESDSFGDQYDAMATYLNQDAEGNWLISSAGDMLYLAQQVNSGKSYQGETILLTNNVDLKNMKWTPIGNASNGFKGTFDGQGNTISNYTVETDINAGLFGYALNSGNIKNLTVKNATVKADDYAGAILGRGYTDVVNCHAENVSVTVTPYLKADGITYDGGAKAGGIVGQLLEGTGNTVVDCSVKNVSITGYRDLGGVLGMAHNNNSVSGCSATNVTINYVSVDGVYDDGKTPNQNAGAIVGRIQSSATVDFTDAENNKFELTRFIATADQLSAALANGGNVSLGADIKVENTVTLADIPAGVSAVLDLNGHDIDVSLNGSAGWSQMFHVNKGATLIVNGEGNVHATSYPTTSYGSVIFNNNAGTLVINGGTYTMTYGTYDEGYLLPAIVDTNSNIGKATTTINGGTFYHNRNMFRNFAQPKRGENNATLIINGGSFNGEADDYASIWNQKTNDQGVVGDGIVVLNGGTFNYVDITNDFQDDTCIKIDPSITNVTINH